MRVICIQGDADKDAIIMPGVEIIEGEVYTVSGYSEYSRNKHGGVDHIPVYKLAERPQDVGYEVSRFAPLSDIDEKEFERNYSKRVIDAIITEP